MKNIPYKARVGIAIGLFIWSILAIIFTIVFAYHHYALWVVILGPSLAVIAFILSIIFMPKSKEGEISNIPHKPKPRNHRPSHYSEKHKRPFISEKEWEELEEEEEECFVMEQNNDD